MFSSAISIIAVYCVMPIAVILETEVWDVSVTYTFKKQLVENRLFRSNWTYRVGYSARCFIKTLFLRLSSLLSTEQPSFAVRIAWNVHRFASFLRFSSDIIQTTKRNRARIMRFLPDNDEQLENFRCTSIWHEHIRHGRSGRASLGAVQVLPNSSVPYSGYRLLVSSKKGVQSSLQMVVKESYLSEATLSVCLDILFHCTFDQKAIHSESLSFSITHELWFLWISTSSDKIVLKGVRVLISICVY